MIMSIENIFALCLAFAGGIILRTLVMNLLSTREQEKIIEELIQHSCFITSLLLIHSNEMRKIVRNQLCDHLSEAEAERFFREVGDNITKQHKILGHNMRAFLTLPTIKDLEEVGFFEIINSCSDIYEKGPVDFLVDNDYASRE
jgi:hypothetical protein